MAYVSTKTQMKRSGRDKSIPTPVTRLGAPWLLNSFCRIVPVKVLFKDALGVLFSVEKSVCDHWPVFPDGPLRIIGGDQDHPIAHLGLSQMRRLVEHLSTRLSPNDTDVRDAIAYLDQL